MAIYQKNANELFSTKNNYIYIHIYLQILYEKFKHSVGARIGVKTTLKEDQLCKSCVAMYCLQ